MRNYTYLSALMLLVGCMSGATYFELNRPDFGDPPADYQEKIKAHLRYRLFDPFSAEYEFGNPERCAFYSGGIAGVPAWGGDRQLGWQVLVRVNAKNRMGGYGGWFSEYHYFNRRGTHHPPALPGG